MIDNNLDQLHTALYDVTAKSIIDDTIHAKAIELFKIPKCLVYRLDDNKDSNLISNLIKACIMRDYEYTLKESGDMELEQSPDLIITSKFQLKDIEVVRFFVKYTEHGISNVFFVKDDDLDTLQNYFVE